jgi:hypothetical protein
LIKLFSKKFAVKPFRKRVSAQRFRVNGFESMVLGQRFRISGCSLFSGLSLKINLNETFIKNKKLGFSEA